MTPAIQDLEVSDLVTGWIWIEEGMEGGPFHNLNRAGREAGTARVRAIAKKYGLELTEIYAECDKRYLAKHGMGLTKLRVEIKKRRREREERYFKRHPIERVVDILLTMFLGGQAQLVNLHSGPGEEPDPSYPGYDDEVSDAAIKAMSSRITDKVAFSEEISEIFVSTDKESLESFVNDVGDLQEVAVSGDTAKGWIVWTSHHFVGIEGWGKMEKRADKPERLLRTFRRLDGRWYNDSKAWDTIIEAPP